MNSPVSGHSQGQQPSISELPRTTSQLAFDFQPRTRLIFGANSSTRIAELVRSTWFDKQLGHSSFGRQRSGHRAGGHFQSIVDLLRSEGIEVEAFHEFGENPTSAMVDEGVRVAARFQPDCLIGLGGGSSLDCCKGINFVYSCGGTIHEYHGVGKATSDLLPMIAVPTTAGTGSETQSFALISDAETHVKMACGDPRAACKIAVLDPVLTLTQPAMITALTGIDAISHAVETYVTRRRNAISITYSRRAFGLLARSFKPVLLEPENLDLRSEMQLGASLAGMAIETSMLGAAHALANPLTARHGIVHGQAVGVMLPSVVRLNGSRHADWYAELLSEIEPGVSSQDALIVWPTY